MYLRVAINLQPKSASKYIFEVQIIILHLHPQKNGYVAQLDRASHYG